MKNAHKALPKPSINLFCANVLGSQREILGVVCRYDGLGLPLYPSLCYEFWLRMQLTGRTSLPEFREGSQFLRIMAHQSV